MNDNTPILTLNTLPPDKQKSYQVFELNGDMDKQGLTLVRQKLEETAQNFPYQYFIFDFSNLNFINSESIGFLMTLHSHLVKMKKKLVVTSAKSHVKDVLSVIGILNVIDYHDSLEAFLKTIA